jgi:hypothetical protein
MLFNEIIAVYTYSYKEHINILLGKVNKTLLSYNDLLVDVV